MSCEINEWSAHVHDDGGKRELHVKGEGDCSTPGHSLRLERTSEGIVPEADLFVVALKVDEPEGTAPQMITHESVEEIFELGDDPATKVQIRGDASATVPIDGVDNHPTG